MTGDLKSEISPAPCDKKCCSEHQTLFACVEGLGTRLIHCSRAKTEIAMATTGMVQRGQHTLPQGNYTHKFDDWSISV